MNIVSSTKKEVIKFHDFNFLQAREKLETADKYHTELDGEICISYLGKRKYGCIPAEALLIATPCCNGYIYSKIEFFDWCQQLLGQQTNLRFRGNSEDAESFCKEVKENNLSNNEIYKLAYQRNEAGQKKGGSEQDS